MKPTFTPPSTRKIEVITNIISIINIVISILCWIFYCIDAKNLIIVISLTFNFIFILANMWLAVKERLRGNYTPINVSIITNSFAFVSSTICLIMFIVL